MEQWDHKTSCRRLLLLICCLTTALPSMAGPAFCHDCDCCSSAPTDSGRAETESPCCCCAPPADEQPSCCQPKSTLTIQQDCRCQDTPPAPQPCPLMEKTENIVSSVTPFQLSILLAAPTPTVDANWHDAKVSRQNGPDLLRSVILLI